MNRRELNISNKTLHKETSEDIILKSPMRIPPQELQTLSDLKNVNSSFYAYYDIEKTEQQEVYFNNLLKPHFFGNSGTFNPGADSMMRMGNFIDV